MVIPFFCLKALDIGPRHQVALTKTPERQAQGAWLPSNGKILSCAKVCQNAGKQAESPDRSASGGAFTVCSATKCAFGGILKRCDGRIGFNYQKPGYMNMCVSPFGHWSMKTKFFSCVKETGTVFFSVFL